MSGTIHDKPSLPAMLRPGHKTADLHRAISTEISRLAEREEHLTIVANSGAAPFARQLARDARDRLSERRDLLMSTPRWGQNRPK